MRAWVERVWVPDPHEIHPWRWRMLALWIVVFTIVSLVYANSSRHTARSADKTSSQTQALVVDLNRTKATVAQLQKTNCSLKIFLLTARKSRYDAYAHELKESPKVAAGDLAAARNYTQLADQFKVGGECIIPPKLKIPEDKLNG